MFITNEGSLEDSLSKYFQDQQQNHHSSSSGLLQSHELEQTTNQMLPLKFIHKIVHLPKIMILHIIRNETVVQNYFKDEIPIKFSMKIDLSKYMKNE